MLLIVNCLRFEVNMGFIYNIIEIKFMINLLWVIMLLFKIIFSL